MALYQMQSSQAKACRNRLGSPPGRSRRSVGSLQECCFGSRRIEALRDEIDASIVSESEQAETRPQPDADTVYDNVFSPDVDATDATRFSTDPTFDGNETTVVDLLNVCLKEEMRRDPSIVVFGEDVADVSREEYLDEVKGKGGVFKVTAGLQREFGSNRVFNSPLAEANIVGRAVGMATRGLKPVVEVQFFDYI